MNLKFAAPSTFKVMASAITSTWVVRAMHALSALIALPLVVCHLGKMQFGIWVLVGQLIGFFSLADLGIASAMARSIAKMRGGNDHQSIHSLLSTALALAALMGLIVAGATCLIAPFVPALIGVSEEYSAITRFVFHVFGFSLAAQFPLRLGMGILTGHQLYGYHAIGKLLTPIFYLSGVVVLAKNQNLELGNLALLSAGAVIVSQGVLLIVAYRLTAPWSLSLKKISLPMSRSLLGMGSSLLLNSLSTLIYEKGMILMIGRILGVPAAGIFGIASALLGHIAALISSLTTPFTTLASEWQASDQMEKLQKTSQLVMRVTVALTTSATVGLFVYGEPLLRLLLSTGGWSVSDFMEASRALGIMGLGLSLGLPQLISRATLQGVGKHWQVCGFSIAASLLSFATSFILMRWEGGLAGAALGWSAYWALTGLVFYPFLINPFLKQSQKQMWVQAYLPGAAVGLFVFAVAHAVSLCLPPTTTPALLTGLGLCAVVGLSATLWVTGQSRKLWLRVRGIFHF